AIRLCERHRRSRPFDPAPYVFLVDLYIAEGQHERVAEACEALTLLGHSTQLLAKKHAYALCHLERYGEAVEVLHEACRQGPPDAWILECLGNCYFTLAAYLQARQAYQRCLELDVDSEARRRVVELL